MNAVHLHYKEIGSGSPLLIIHGLYGSGDNWITIARELSTHYRVIVPDLRNHGKSPHHSEHHYEALVEDIVHLCKHLQLEHLVVMGHSMGGKIAMKMALTYPHMITKLIIVDVAPKNYVSAERAPKSGNDNHYILECLLKLPIDTLTTREAIDEKLAENIKSKTLRNFLLKNILRTPQGFQWKANLEVLQQALPQMMGGFDTETRTCNIPTLFLKGETSPYIQEKDKATIVHRFPHAQIHTIAQAGHWLHAQQPQPFLDCLYSFLNPIK